MLFRNKIALSVLTLALVTLMGCGSSSNQASAPPGGAFSNSNLNGTYILSFSGYDISSSNGSFFVLAGSLTADGNGNFTGGTVDINDPALGSAHGTSYSMNHLSASGHYTITADGRGSGSITVPINGQSVYIGLDFALSSNSHGLITRFDLAGSGSGTLDLQTANVSQSALQGTYAFGLDGVDSTIVNPLTTAGSFTLDANGNITSGVQDFNDNGGSEGLRDRALQGTVAVGAPGTSQLTTNVSGFGSLQFDVWPIDATHLKLIETDSKAFLEGDACVATAQMTFPSGQLVFTTTGEDTGGYPFASAGLLTSDGSSQITGGQQDLNDDGYYEQVQSVRGSFSTSGPRSVVTLNGIYNGNFYNNAPGTGSYTFAAYPYAGGAFLVEIDNGAGSSTGISGGTIYRQSSTSLTSSEGYAFNLSGANGNGEVDMIAQFTANGTNMTGLYDVNNLGYLQSDESLGTGTYSLGSNGRGTLSFPSLQTGSNSFISALNLAFYVVDNSTVVFVETDDNQLGTGMFQLQGSTDANSSAQVRSSFTRPKASSQATMQIRH